MAARPHHEMPDDVARALMAEGLMSEYRDRPFYQRNDYLGWITRAKKPETRTRRIRQMIEELELGGVYMGMDHPPSRKT